MNGVGLECLMVVFGISGIELPDSVSRECFTEISLCDCFLVNRHIMHCDE